MLEAKHGALVCPRAKSLARCEGLQLMRVIASVAELQKSVIACELQHLLSETPDGEVGHEAFEIVDCVCTYLTGSFL